MLNGVEIGSADQKELILVVGTGCDYFGVWSLSRGECQMILIFSSCAPTKILSA